MNESRICIALDFKTKSDVENFLKQFEGESLYVKVEIGRASCRERV